MRSSFDLSRKTALVTGASSGIGAGIATGLAAAGADLVLLGRNTERLDAVAHGVTQQGRAAYPMSVDITRPPDLADCFARLDDMGTTATVLVANAGILRPKPSLDISPDEWDETLDANLKSAFLVAQQCARRLKERGRSGSIIFVGSATSVRGSGGAANYTASKSGLLGLIRTLSVEWGPLGIRVNGVGPGFVPTPMTEVQYEDRAWRDMRLASIPLRRFGTPDDIAGPATFLASDASSYVTGQMLYVDGGYSRSL